MRSGWVRQRGESLVRGLTSVVVSIDGLYQWGFYVCAWFYFVFLCVVIALPHRRVNRGIRKIDEHARKEIFDGTRLLGRWQTSSAHPHFCGMICILAFSLRLIGRIGAFIAGRNLLPAVSKGWRERNS